MVGPRSRVRIPVATGLEGSTSWVSGRSAAANLELPFQHACAVDQRSRSGPATIWRCAAPSEWARKLWGDVELVFGIAFAVALCAFCVVGLAVGSTAEGPDPTPLPRSGLDLRITRAALLGIAVLLNLLGAQAALVAGSGDDPSAGRAEAIVFLLEGVANLGLTLVVLMPAWSLRRMWVLRLLAVCWLVVGAPALVLTVGRGPLVSFYLGFGPDAWAAFAVVVGAVLVWLSSLGGGHEVEPTGRPAPETAPVAAVAPSSPARRPPAPPTHWRGIVSGVALACLVALSIWPLAQFTGFNALGGCAPGWLVPSDPEFCVSGALEGHILTISGRTTLPDGAVIDLSVKSGFVDTASTVVGNEQVAVKSGRFEGTFAVPINPALRDDTIVATATVLMDEQPAAVKKHYGSDGRAMAGPAASGACLGSGGRCLLATLSWSLPAS